MKSRTETFRLKPEATQPGELARRSAKRGGGWLPALAGRAIALSAAVLSVLSIAGCRQDMHNQPKYRPLRATTFFADGSSARPLVEGTIARGTVQEDQAFFTGKVGNAPVRELPFPIDDAVLTRGQERYN